MTPIDQPSPHARVQRGVGASGVGHRCAAGMTVLRLGCLYLALGVLKYVLPLPVLARWSWREPRGARNPVAERQTIGWAIWVRRLFGRTDRDCLQRSLLLYRELSRAGADPALVVGFARTDGRVRGHAWVVADGSLVAETTREAAPFVPAFSFGRRGTRTSA